jgi:hypothetical protein
VSKVSIGLCNYQIATLAVTSLEITRFYVGVEVITAVIMKRILFCHVMSLSPKEVHRRFGEKYCINLCLRLVGFFLVLFLDSEDGVSKFLLNVNKLLPD